MTTKTLPSIEKAVKSLLSVNMGLKEDERLVVLGDSAGDGGELAREVGSIAEELHRHTRTIIFDPVQMAVCSERGVGAPSRGSAIQVSESGSYSAPVSVAFG